jgi:hypothetical protein
MWDRDDYDPDDWLGTILLDHWMRSPYGMSGNPLAWGAREMVFNRNGADHRVRYYMGAVPDHYCG